MASKVLTSISLIIELVLTVLLYYLAYNMYKSQCVQGWVFWVWLLMPLIVLTYLISMLLIAELKNKTFATMFAILGLVILIFGFIVKIWFLVKMFGCSGIETYLKILFVVLTIISMIVNSFNK